MVEKENVWHRTKNKSKFAVCGQKLMSAKSLKWTFGVWVQSIHVMGGHVWTELGQAIEEIFLFRCYLERVGKNWEKKLA